MDNYFNINVDFLFEQFSIKEIDTLNKKIQNESDGKKEELRTMVGERYRDLIQAADTITEMKCTSKKIEDVISKSEIADWKRVEPVKDKQDDFKEDIYDVAAQIKVLLNLIDLISIDIDDGNFLEATQLFLLSRHINSCIKLDSHSNIIKKFPVARKIWDLLSPFNDAIKTQCLKTLEEENMNLDKTVNCLGSLILLDNIQYKSSLKTFVEIREKTFMKLLNEERYIVKDKLLASVMELMNTTKIVHEAFINHNGNEGLLIQKISKLSSDNVLWPLALSERRPALMNINVLSKFKLRCNHGELNREIIKITMSHWLDSVKKITFDHLKDVVKYIVSINTIHEIEKQIQNISKPNNWSDICLALYDVDNVEFYEKFYQPLILERIYNIINISWDNIQNDFKMEIEKLTVLINDRVHRDMKHYVWMNDDTDNPQSLKDALNMEQKTHNLLMKVNGYNKYVVDICLKLDSNLKKLIDDLKEYILATSNFKKSLKSKDFFLQNQEKLLIYLQNSSKENICALVSYVKSSVLMNDPENCHLLARLLQAISEMCPNLKNCFSRSFLIDYAVYFTEGYISEDGDNWREISQILVNESIQLWIIWLNGFMIQLTVTKIDGELSSYALTKEFPTWRFLFINEKGENNQNIESKIYIPQQLSIATQCWIFNLISSMNKMIPHTLPKQIHQQIVEEFNNKLYEHYHFLCSQKELISNQKIAWQILFDLKVLIGLFSIRDNKSKNDNFQELINECKSIIDPFDFDVFYPHVVKNIKDNISRLHYEMGCMVPYSNYNNIIVQNQNVIHIHDSDPNIITMSKSHAERSWIPLLPIIKSNKGFAAEHNKEKIKQSIHVKKTSMPMSTSSSTLSSLQEWFK